MKRYDVELLNMSEYVGGMQDNNYVVFTQTKESQYMNRVDREVRRLIKSATHKIGQAVAVRPLRSVTPVPMAGQFI